LSDLSEKQLRLYLDEIQDKLNSYSIVNSKWEERLKSIKLLHSIAITPLQIDHCLNISSFCGQIPSFYSSHPLFISALTCNLSASSTTSTTHVPLKILLSKQFADGRSFFIKSLCECLSDIAICFFSFFYFLFSFSFSFSFIFIVIVVVIVIVILR
jgi:hypothetical protein